MSYVGNSCPNCGAPITAPVCDYCGTRHLGLEQVPTSKVVDMLDKGLISINQAREMVGLKRLEEERIILELELAKAKTKALNDQCELKRLYSEALLAMRKYRI